MKDTVQVIVQKAFFRNRKFHVDGVACKNTGFAFIGF